jgi:RNA polymerase sigma factor (TIGR02999 family)
MNAVTQVVDDPVSTDPHASADLLPLVYDALRRLAADRLAREAPGQTLEPTALVHEAYLRLAADGSSVFWDSRGHFFAAAAEAMRRILVEIARRKHSVKRGGAMDRQPLDDGALVAFEPREDLLALDEALTRLAESDPSVASLVQLRYFGGLSIPEAAQVLGISPRTADRHWAYARAWLYQALDDGACQSSTQRKQVPALACAACSTPEPGRSGG